MAYDPAIIAAIKRRAAKVPDPSARSRYLNAALQIGIVESGLRNLSGGDADSAGWRQERASLYKDPTNVTASVNRVFDEFAQHDRGQPSWRLAADVQRPAAQFRGRYKGVAQQAARLAGGGAVNPQASAASAAASANPALNALTTMAYGPLQQAARPQPQITAPTLPPALAAKVPALGAQTPVSTAARPDRLNVTDALNALARTTSDQSGQRATLGAGAGTSSGLPSRPTSGKAQGTATFEGKKVAGWIAPILTYARQQGWKGTVNSGYRSLADQTRIYNSGVRPAAKPGTSNHEGADFPRGAVDVSDASSLSQILARSPYGKKLVWAGGKDPVHFSHPHGGSY